MRRAGYIGSGDIGASLLSPVVSQRISNIGILLEIGNLSMKSCIAKLLSSVCACPRKIFIKQASPSKPVMDATRLGIL